MKNVIISGLSVLIIVGALNIKNIDSSINQQPVHNGGKLLINVLNAFR